MNDNAIFAALLIKYLAAKKIKNNQMVNDFITNHQISDIEYKGFPDEPTDSIIEFGQKAFKKGMIMPDDLRNYLLEITREAVSPIIEPRQRFGEF